MTWMPKEDNSLHQDKIYGQEFSSELSLEIVKAIQAIPSLPCREVQIVKKPTFATKVSASGVPFTVVESSEASAPQRIEDRRGI